MLKKINKKIVLYALFVLVFSISLFTSLSISRVNTNPKSEEYCNDAEEIMELALEESDLKLDEYLSIEGLNATSKELVSFTDGKMNLSAVENADELEQYSNTTMKEAILNIYDDMSEDEVAVLKDLANEDEDVSNLVALLENGFEDDVLDTETEAECSSLSNGKVVKLSAGVAALGACLAGAGLSGASIAAIKGAFSAMLAALKLWFTPTVIKAAIAVAAILVITVVIIVNWDKVEAIFNAIVDFFVQAAGKIASFVQKAMTTIYNKAIDSTIVCYKWIDGLKVGFRYLTQALASKLMNELSREKYLLVLDIHGGQPIQCSTKIYTKKQTMAKLKLDYSLSCYTPRSDDAYKVLRDAFPEHSVTHAERGTGEGWQFRHYHVQTFNKETNQKDKLGNIHSLYGLPVYY